MIEITNLSFGYKNNTILKCISMTLNNNQIYGLVGRNGSGKTTMFDCIQGKYNSYQGDVIIDGVSYRNKSYLQNPITVINNDKIFFNNLTVEEHFNLLKKTSTELYTIFSEYNLDIYRNCYPYQLSLGTAQRFNIALRMQQNNCRNIIADEPFNGLDPIEVESLKKKFIDLKKNKMVLISSHDISSLVSICDFLIFLKDGKITVEQVDQKTDKRKVNEFL